MRIIMTTILIIGMLLANCAVFAQDQVNSGTLLRDFNQQTDESLQSTQKPAATTADVQAEPAETVQQISGDTAIDVKTFKITGVDGIAIDFTEIVKSFENRQDTLDDLIGAAAAVSEKLRSEGYLLATAYIPQQNVSGGEVELIVLPGKYGSVRINNTSPVADSTILGRMQGISEGAYITKSSLDKAVLRINDLTGAAAKAVLDTGNGAPGVADLVMNISTDNTAEVGGSVSASNYGNAGTGQYQGMVSLNWNNMTGHADSINVFALAGETTNFSQNGLLNGAVNYSIPENYFGGDITLSYSQVDYQLTGNLAATGNNGAAYYGTLGYSYPLQRSRATNWNAAVALNYKNTRDNMWYGQINNNKQLGAVQLGVNGNTTDTLLSGAYNYYGVNLNVGDMNGTSNMFSINNGWYQYLTGNYQRYQFIGERGQLFVSVNGQAAAQNLNSSEQISLGGPYAVRAYTPGYASGDMGAYGTVELRYAVAYPWEENIGMLRPYIFVDGGVVQYEMSSKYPGISNGTALGAIGAGLTLSQQGLYNVKLDVARVMPGAPVDPDGAIARVWLRAGVQF